MASLLEWNECEHRSRKVGVSTKSVWTLPMPVTASTPPPSSVNDASLGWSLEFIYYRNHVCGRGIGNALDNIDRIIRS